jgi:hypothetical protein
VADFAVDADLAAVDGVDAGRAFDQSGLSRAVVADEGADLSGVDREIDVGEDLHRSEALRDAGEFEQHR